MSKFNLESRISNIKKGFSVLGVFSRIRNLGSNLGSKVAGVFGYNNKDDNSNTYKGDYVYGSNTRKEFVNYVGSKYKISQVKLTKLLDIVEHQFIRNKGKKSRKEILKEEEAFSKEYTQFQQYMAYYNRNFVGKAVIEKVNLLYKENEGKMSTARIFHELKARGFFAVGMRYNEDENRYEVFVNNKAEDIRNLPFHKLKRDTAFFNHDRTFRDYSNKRLDEETKYKIKRDIIFGIHNQMRKDVYQLRELGFNASYEGVDDILEERYNVGTGSHSLGSRGYSGSSFRNKYHYSPIEELVGSY